MTIRKNERKCNRRARLRGWVVPITIAALEFSRLLACAGSTEELDQENGFLKAHFGDLLSESDLMNPPIYRSGDRRLVVAQKRSEKAEWKGYPLKTVCYVFLDEELVRIFAVMSASVNFYTFLDSLRSEYGRPENEGQSYDGRRSYAWHSPVVDLECVNFNNSTWIDMYSAPLKGDFRNWREKNPQEFHERWRHASISEDKEALVTERRIQLLQDNFNKLIPIRFQKDKSGKSLVQRLPVSKYMFEWEGLYYCGFTFSVPAWFDGDFEWMFFLAKSQAEKDFFSGVFRWIIIPQTGRSSGTQDFETRELGTVLKRTFRYTKSLILQRLDRQDLEPGKTYAICFSFAEHNMPDIAFSLTVDSMRGAEETGTLPLQ
jgi:hypothetical protein